jgi:hypothetical protein
VRVRDGAELGLVDGGGEALHRVVAGVHLHQQRGARRDGASLVVARVGAVGGADLDQRGAGAAMMSGMRKAPPISTSSPRETITSLRAPGC